MATEGDPMWLHIRGESPLVSTMSAASTRLDKEEDMVDDSNRSRMAGGGELWLDQWLDKWMIGSVECKRMVEFSDEDDDDDAGEPNSSAAVAAGVDGGKGEKEDICDGDRLIGSV